MKHVKRDIIKKFNKYYVLQIEVLFPFSFLQGSKNLIMNGIPKNSVIRIFNPPSSVRVFTVPLEPNYNGSLEMLTIRNLTIHSGCVAKLQFCSNGGCGPDVEQPLSCDVCESLGEPGMVADCLLFIN